jgi:hypothetical protein
MIAVQWKTKKLWLLLLSFVVLLVLFIRVDQAAQNQRAASAMPASTTVPASPAAAAPAGKFPKELPDPATFMSVAQKGNLSLKADINTGHFIVEDSRTGKRWTSFPDPSVWSRETVQGTWRSNLRSPLMYDTIDLTKKVEKEKSANIIDDAGEITDFKRIEDGFQLVFSIPNKELAIPIQVKLTEDEVETKIMSDEIKEGKHSLITVRLYPFFGASQSVGQDGYILIPDGSGSLIRFKEDRDRTNYTYTERVYGVDWPFAHTTQRTTGRMSVNYPVFGIKSGGTALFSIIHEGAEYAEIVASPSETYSKYNFASVQQVFREKFFQPTTGTRRDDKIPQGYSTYNRERFGQNRTTRYTLLTGKDSDYVGMAVKYRSYLIEEFGLKPMEGTNKGIPMFVDILGGDREKGFITDRYVQATTTSQALKLIQDLKERGVSNMSITYRGWQDNGYSSHGGHFPVDKRIGGNEGMKQFVSFAKTEGFPVFLYSTYEWNNNGEDGYNPRNHAMVDLGGQIIKYQNHFRGDKETFVSPGFMKEVLKRDLGKYKELGVSGISLGGIGRYLNSDFNSKFGLNRSQSLKLQKELMQQLKDTLGLVQADSMHAYGLPYVGSILDMAMDYSYDLFTDEVVPFAPLALHGLVSYTSNPLNDSVQYKEEVLRSIEYGASPYFIFSHADAATLKHTYTASYYWNTSYDVWSGEAATEYERFNHALGDVQNLQMTGHRTIAPKVKETTYANGRRIIVNYNTVPVTADGVQVPALDFTVLEGGAGDHAKK